MTDDPKPPSSDASASATATVPATVSVETPVAALVATPVETPIAAPAAAPVPTEEPTPTPAPATHVAPTPAQRTGPLDPRVAALLAMFPDFDESVMGSVLESVNGNQDQAVEILLGMSDPEYKPPPGEQRAPMSQSDLDEQFARQLMLQDQEAHARAVHHEQQQRRDQQVPPDQHPHQEGQGQGQDPMVEIQQQLNKGLEVGKKTFNSLFNKAKQKFNEFEQQRQQTQIQGQTSTTQPWGQNPADQSRTNYHTQPEAPQAAYYDPNPVANSTQPQSQQSMSSSPPPMPNRPSLDGSKIGVLPKKPVSLIPEFGPATHSEPPKKEDDGLITLTDKTTKPDAAPLRKNTEDEELEYEENPFEDDERRR